MKAFVVAMVVLISISNQQVLAGDSVIQIVKGPNGRTYKIDWFRLAKYAKISNVKVVPGEGYVGGYVNSVIKHERIYFIIEPIYNISVPPFFQATFFDSDGISDGIGSLMSLSPASMGWSAGQRYRAYIDVYPEGAIPIPSLITFTELGSYHLSGYNAVAVANSAKAPAAPYKTNRTYEPGDGYRYPLYYNPATASYFYYPVIR